MYLEGFTRLEKELSKVLEGLQPRPAAQLGSDAGHNEPGQAATVSEHQSSTNEGGEPSGTTPLADRRDRMQTTECLEGADDVHTDLEALD